MQRQSMNNRVKVFWFDDGRSNLKKKKKNR